ncbi:hypothetical protein PHISP_05852 [Aspergillus sp. HF37]|nr:hypothetical protein PHISP_05852 [Aspergillus sp. HF37]
MNRLVVEDLDMEKLAMNSTLGRLWRTWRKCIRSKTLGRAASRESFRRPASTQPFSPSRKSSIVTADELPSRSVSRPVMEEEEAVDPASIPLPMSQHDVREIEVPGFCSELEGEIQTLEAVVAHKVRPRSLMVFQSPSNSPRSPSSTASSPILSSNSPGAKANHHVRSRSLPNASYFPDRAWDNDQVAATAAGDVSPAASDEGKRLETMYEYDEPTEFVDAQTGIAISTEQADNAEPPKAAAADSLPGEKGDPTAVEEAVVGSSHSAASIEVVASQASSVHASAASATDHRPQQEGEVIEGQGMCEKPKQAVQRPKRNSSKDPARSEGPARPITEDQPLKQGGESAEPAANRGPSDTSDSAATFLVPEDQTSNDDPAPKETPQERADSSGTVRPESVSTGDSERSEHLRTRPKPSKLVLQSGNTQVSGKSPVSPGSERAAVQRVSIRPSPSVTSSTNSDPRRSDSFTSAREKRPVTAGSATSQVSTKLKGLIARQPGEASSPRLRSSSETSRASGGSGDSGNLEKLIKSDETLHFTLTPKSMREMEEPDSPRWRAVPRSDNDDQTQSAQNTGTSENETQAPGRSNPSRMTVDLASVSKSKSVEFSKPIPAGRASLQPKPKAAQARDAKPATESTREFADFIKSTGPPVPANPEPRVVGAPKPSEPARPARPVPSKNASTRGKNGPKLEARSAVPAKGDETSDLIDFIREGPPTPGVNRIPRVVAPFRDTTDSEDPETSGPERMEKEPQKRGSLASTQGSSMANKSFTSVGSRTGLLESTPRSTTTQAGPNTKASAPVRSVSDDPLPARKQRRVRDPYAIDSDDSDDLDELLEPQKPQREEESLIDFLRNAPPPESQPPAQPLNTASSNKMRLLAKQASDKVPPVKSPFRQQPGNSPGGQSNYAVKVGMERNGGSGGSGGGPPASTGRQTETSALADFLKNTGPPEPPPAPRPSAREMGANSISRLFTRRKKVEV